MQFVVNLVGVFGVMKSVRIFFCFWVIVFLFLLCPTGVAVFSTDASVVQKSVSSGGGVPVPKTVNKSEKVQSNVPKIDNPEVANSKGGGFPEPQSSTLEKKGNIVKQNKYSSPVTEKEVKNFESKSTVSPLAKAPEKKIDSVKPPEFKVEKKAGSGTAVGKNVHDGKPNKLGDGSVKSEINSRKSVEGVVQSVVENQGYKPSDLPEVDTSEFDLPQVVAAHDTKRASSFLLVALAWLLIVFGILVVIFVIFRSRRRYSSGVLPIDGDFSSGSESGKKKCKKRLLSEKYYK